MNIKENFERVGFTPEEKMNLTARLQRAAEQEDNMTTATKKKIKRISGSMIFGIAAAAVMTVGTLAAVINPSVRSWFIPADLGAAETLEQGICRLDRSETYNGWTVTLTECAGDDVSAYIWVDVAAPEGTVLSLPEPSYFYADYTLEQPLDDGESMRRSGGSMLLLPDEDLEDNHIAFLIHRYFTAESLQGKTVNIEISALSDHWWEVRENADDILHEEGTELTAAVRDYTWVFEDVTLDFSNQTIHLEPNVEVPWLNGTTTLTKLEISPFNVTVRVEGGSCATYIDRSFQLPTAENGQSVSIGGATITSGVLAEDNVKEVLSERDMRNALTVGLTLQDGTILTPTIFSNRCEGRSEGIEGPETPFFEKSLRCAEYSNYPSQIWDPTQVEYVTVCGVDIPVNPTPAEH